MRFRAEEGGTHLAPIDVGDLPSLEARNDLVLQVAPVDVERSRLPERPVSFEHGFGDGVEEGLGRIAGRLLSAPRRCPRGRARRQA